MKTLGELVRGKNYKELLNIYKKIKSGEIVIEDPNPPRDYYEYITRLDYSSWFWAGLCLIALTLVSIVLSSYSYWVQLIRYIVGTVFVVFIPGYFTLEALYPSGKEFNDLEKLALSIGLSLALVPLIGLLLNYTPWGIRLWPVTIALSVYSIIMALVASYRKYLVIRRKLIASKAMP